MVRACEDDCEDDYEDDCEDDYEDDCVCMRL